MSQAGSSHVFLVKLLALKKQHIFIYLKKIEQKQRGRSQLRGGAFRFWDVSYFY